MYFEFDFLGGSEAHVFGLVGLSLSFNLVFWENLFSFLSTLYLMWSEGFANWNNFLNKLDIQNKNSKQNLN